MIFAISPLLNEIVETTWLFALLKESVGSLLVFSTSMHCLAKKFENKTGFLIFQLWQLGDSACTEIFEITEYLCYFGNNFLSPTLLI